MPFGDDESIVDESGIKIEGVDRTAGLVRHEQSVAGREQKVSGIPFSDLADAVRPDLEAGIDPAVPDKADAGSRAYPKTAFGIGTNGADVVVGQTSFFLVEGDVCGI